MSRYIFVALLLTFSLPALVILLYRQELIAAAPSFLYQTTLVVALFTSIIFIYLFRAQRGDYFVRLYLLSMVVKLLGFLAYNVIIVIEDPAGAVGNVLYFLLLYFIFTAVEIGLLYRKIAG
ncbi:MAG TPA: hypothetical protein VF490_17765 [Chryseosolibacter sp.]